MRQHWLSSERPGRPDTKSSSAIDEVGRGAWAGPLMVGAAVLPRSRRVYGVRDSKMLTEERREVLFDRVASWCTAWSVGGASQLECDTLG